MRHRITSYRRDELYSNHKEYSTEANTDEEASAKIQQLRRNGHTIASWTQNAVVVQKQKKK